MRYTVHTHRTFHHRITKYLGVLVAAALVAVLGLPSVAQAQKIATVAFMDGDGFTVTWELAARTASPDSWVVTFTKPSGTKEVVYVPSGMTATLDQSDEGTWWIQVAGCYGTLDEDGVCEADDLDSGGDSVGYTHGPPAAPKNLTASLVPGGVALTWTPVKNDLGYAMMPYQVRQDEGEDEGDWGPASADGAMVVQVDAGDYTFMVRAVGRSDNSTSTEATDIIASAAASVDITVPMPTPTLPEIAALFLAMLLLGSGAYLLRRRQSGGLTSA